MSRLKVIAVKGYTTRAMDLLSQNDPFIKFRMEGHEDQHTSAKQNQNVPVWNQVFYFTEQINNTLELIVYDQDQFVNQTIGTGSIDLTPYFKGKQAESVFVRISEDSIPAGKILLKIIPENSRNIPADILSNENINFYRAANHYGYHNDFQKEGNVLAMIQKQVHLDQQIVPNLINKDPTNINTNSNLNQNQNQKNITNHSSNLMIRSNNQYNMNQMSQNQVKSSLSSNYHQPVRLANGLSRIRNFNTPNLRQINQRSNYTYQNTQYPISESKIPIKFIYSQPSQSSMRSPTDSRNQTFNNTYQSSYQPRLNIYPQVVYPNNSHSTYNFLDPNRPPTSNYLNHL